jgi:HD-like signal output (HDOD) protein
LITKDKIDSYIEKIPPAPTALKNTLMHLKVEDLTKAAAAAKEDKALNAYLTHLLNKPIFGFRNEVHETSQIFGILGVAKSQQAVYNYMMTLLSPSKWVLFKLDKTTFYNLQAELTVSWQKILKHLDIVDKDIESAVSLLPASLIVSEALFCEKLDDVNLLRSVNPIDLNTILKRLCGEDLFDISVRISKKWDMDPKISTIIQAASGLKPAEDEMLNRLGKWMHLLLFFTLSKANYVDAGLNDFIDFQIDYVQDIYDDFATLMEIS